MKKFIHIDMDCFYAAVEMRENPHYKTLPLAIGGPPDKRGVISTANYIARQFGVKSAMATGQAIKLCPNLIILPGRINFYKQVSEQIHEIFRRYTNLIEPLSLDEAYLDVTNSRVFDGSATLIAQDIRKAIYDELNLTASAGVASLMFLAKIASDINKPNGQFVITPNEVNSFIEGLELRKIPGIGKVTAEKLKILGFKTCLDIKKSNLPFLVQKFGKLGISMWNKAHGIDDREVVSDRVRKSISVEKTLNEDIYDWKEFTHHFDILYRELEQRINRNDAIQLIRKINVKIKFEDFKQTTLEMVSSELNYLAYMDLSKRVWDGRRNMRGVRTIGLGTILSAKEPIEKQQLSLMFD
ncbi:DNA polymerase IV [Thorsellia anophelis]|uniref:DNA polymerase IV n=1 Tax=Thorsellia anophelis TaxID=336804 RepID=UPI000B80C3DD|nr:DNA polymerase IV [Thorsellia anophelis]